jgi:hypothetical protein
MARLTSKPIPRNRKDWDSEVRGVERFLAEMKDRDFGPFDGWRRKMEAYYTRRLRDLKAHKPAPTQETR